MLHLTAPPHPCRLLSLLYLLQAYLKLLYLTLLIMQFFFLILCPFEPFLCGSNNWFVDMVPCKRSLRGEDSLLKVGTDVRARALGISWVHFCPGIRLWEINFSRALGFWQKSVIFDKRVKSNLLAEKAQFWHSKAHENLPSHSILANVIRPLQAGEGGGGFPSKDK